MAETNTHTAMVQEVDRKAHMHPFTSVAEHAEGVPKLMVEGAGIHLSEDLLTIDPERILDVVVEKTIVGGRVVFER